MYYDSKNTKTSHDFLNRINSIMKSFLEHKDNLIQKPSLEYEGNVSDLVEAALTWGELTRPDRTFRVDTFLKKYGNSEAFELIDGKFATFEYDPAFAKAVKDGDKKTAMDIGLITTTGEKLTFGKLQKNAEFGGGTRGSGGGSKGTTITESAQCVYAQALWNNPKTEFSPADISKAYTQCFVNGSLSDILTMDESWIESSIMGAKILKRALGSKNYQWFRGVGFQVEIEGLYSPLNKVSGSFFSNINKWCPADIWAVAESGKYKFNESENLDELNEKLLQAYNDRSVIGISLKKIEGRAKLASVNYRKPMKPVKFTKFTLGKKDFFNSKDGYLMYNDGEMQFRTFPEFQCEIIGKKAKHGKVSQGPMRKILNLAGGKSFEERNGLFGELSKNRDYFFQKFYKEYNDSKLTKKMAFSKFEEMLKDKKPEWLVSKYMVTQVFNYAKGKEQKFAELLIRYAKSSSPTSAVFLKIK